MGHSTLTQGEQVSKECYEEHVGHGLYRHILWFRKVSELSHMCHGTDAFLIGHVRVMAQVHETWVRCGCHGSGECVIGHVRVSWLRCV